ncbi:MAG TPA: CopD family protein [Conexibacter sp.]|nr:CopD family protein [Conexibacter sp.]
MSTARSLRSGLAVMVAVAVCLAAPAVAFAHAQLEGTMPQRGAVVRTQPPVVAFRFDEPVEGSFGAIRVFDRNGGRGDAGAAFHPGGRGSVLGAHLKPGLARGTYTATYRVVSADGHIVSGGFVFSIGRASGTGLTVGQLTAGGSSGPATETAFGLARGLQFLAIALAVGALAFLLLVWRPALRELTGREPAWDEAGERFAARSRQLVAPAVMLGVVSAAAAVVLEGAEAAGISGFAALRPAVVRETLGTRFGTVWGLGVLAWVLFGALAAFAPKRRWALLALAVPAGFLVVLPALSGHAATQSPEALLVPLDVVHVAAMSVWAGGLALLLLGVPAATRRLEPAGRGRLLAAVLVRFSPLALAAVAAILVTGLAQSYVYVRTPAHLLDTAFGRAVLIKFVLLMALITLGVYQRRRSLPWLRRIAADGEAPGRAGVMLRRVLRGELALIVFVLGVTAALTAYAPSIAAQSGPFNATTGVGPAQLQLTIDPARVGANEIHLYLLNPRDGTQYRGAKEVDVEERLPARDIGPLTQTANLAGPGHYVVPGAVLGVSGTWEVQVTVRVSAFDEYLTTVEVPVR